MLIAVCSILGGLLAGAVVVDLLLVHDCRKLKGCLRELEDLLHDYEYDIDCEKSKYKGLSSDYDQLSRQYQDQRKQAERWRLKYEELESSIESMRVTWSGHQQALREAHSAVSELHKKSAIIDSMMKVSLENVIYEDGQVPPPEETETVSGERVSNTLMGLVRAGGTNLEEEAKEMAGHPDVVAAWEKMQQAK